MLTTVYNHNTLKQSVNPPQNGGFALHGVPVADSDSQFLVESQSLRLNVNLGDVSYKNTSAKTLTEKRFHLLDVASNLLIKKYGRDKDGFPNHRISKCCSYKAPLKENIEIHRTGEKTATYHNLETCSHVHACPVCSNRISEIRRVELNFAVAGAIDNGKYFPVLLTYTMSHKEQHTLVESLDRLTTAYAGLCGHADYKKLKSSSGYKHAIRAFEVTWSWINGWHPHFHVIALFDHELTKDEFDEFKSKMAGFWTKELARVGGFATTAHGFDAVMGNRDVFDYINKFGKEPTDIGWDMSKEMMRGHFKTSKRKGKTPFEILALAEHSTAYEELYIEYVEAMHNRKQLVWSRGLKDELGIKEIADELLKEYQEKETELILELDAEQWKAILHFKWRGKLLAYAAVLPLVRLRSIVSSLVRAYKRKFPQGRVFHIGQAEHAAKTKYDYLRRWNHHYKLGVHIWTCTSCGRQRFKYPHITEVCKHE